MHRKLGNHWVECKDPVDLMDRQSNMYIDLHWYQKGTNNKQTCNHTNHLMLDLEQ